MIQGEIIAPELPSDRNRFSFASASPSSSCMLSQQAMALDYHSESLLLQNPYGVSPRLLLTALTTSNANDGEFIVFPPGASDQSISTRWSILVDFCGTRLST